MDNAIMALKRDRVESLRSTVDLLKERVAISKKIVEERRRQLELLKVERLLLDAKGILA